MADRERARVAVHEVPQAPRAAILVQQALRRALDNSASSSGQDEVASSQQDAAIIHAELISAVKRADETACSHWATLAAQRDLLDQRAERHRAGGAFLLSAPPLWLAVYSADLALTLQLLRGGADPEAHASACVGGSGDCVVGGQSALHVAVARGTTGCVSCLLSHRAAIDAPFCFGVADDDEPEWDEQSATWVGGLVGLSALQLAAQRATSTVDASAQICRALLSHGADGSKLQASASTSAAMAPLLQAVTTSDGEALDCPICLSEVLTLNSVWTPCCARGFHDHCLSKQTKCPMCRTALPSDLVDARASDLAVGSANASDLSVSRHEMLVAMTNSERRDAALDLAFQSSAWSDDGATGLGQTDVPMGSNYGWRAMTMGAF